jgi:hypothetical protein
VPTERKIISSLRQQWRNVNFFYTAKNLTFNWA